MVCLRPIDVAHRISCFWIINQRRLPPRPKNASDFRKLTTLCSDAMSSQRLTNCSFERGLLSRKCGGDIHTFCFSFLTGDRRQPNVLRSRSNTEALRGRRLRSCGFGPDALIRIFEVRTRRICALAYRSGLKQFVIAGSTYLKNFDTRFRLDVKVQLAPFCTEVFN